MPTGKRSIRAATSCLIAVCLAGSLVPVTTGCTSPDRASAEYRTDHDGDRVLDYVEKQLGLSTESADTDMDGLSDYYELTTDPAAGENRVNQQPGASTAFAAEGATSGAQPDTSAASPSEDASHAQPRPPKPAPPAPVSPAPAEPAKATTGAIPAVTPDRRSASGNPDWDAITKRHADKLRAGGTLAVNDPWRRGIAYDMTINDIRNVHASISGQWSWSGTDVPTVVQYVAAFKARLADDKTTPAPCVDEKASQAGFIDADPDFAGATLASASQALQAATQPIASGGFVGWEYVAKIHNGLCDADGDGIPNFYEAYGYTLNRSSGLPGGLGSWGFKKTGSASYVVSKADGSHGPFWAAWGSGGTHPTPAQYYPGVVTGSGFTLIPVSERDYTDEYYKTDSGSYNTDGDADTDDAEALGDASVAADRKPWNTPVVAGLPSFRINVTGAKVSYISDNLTFPDDPDWLDTVANVATTWGPVVGQIANVASKVLPLVVQAPANDGIAAAPAPAAPKPADEPVVVTFGPSQAYAATSSAPSTPSAGAAASAMLSNLSGGLKDISNIVGQVKGFMRLLWPKATQPIDWSRVTIKDESKPAGTVAMQLNIVNDARVDAVDVTPAYTLLLGESVVGTYTCANTVTLGKGGSPVSFQTPAANLDLDHLRAAMTGGSFNVIPNVAGGHLHKRVGNPLADVDLGAWDGFRSDIDKSCATVMFDGGNGYLAQYQIAATHDTTVRDAFYECLRDYDGSGAFLGFTLPNTDPAKTAKHFQPADLRDWAVVFDSRMDGAGKHYYWTDPVDGRVNVSDPDLKSSMDVPLTPRGIVQFIHKDRMNSGAVFASARMSYGSLEASTTGKLDHKSLVVTLANRSECVSSVDVVFLPTGDATAVDHGLKMRTADDGVYTLDLPGYVWTGKEKVVAQLRGFDGVVTSDPYPVSPPAAPNLLLAYGSGGSTTYDADWPAFPVVVAKPRRIGYVLGTADLKTKAVTWATSVKIDDDGTDPAVCLNKDGVALLHYVNAGGHGVERVGNLRWTRAGDSSFSWSIDWSDATIYETGVAAHPAVDMNDAGQALEMHEDGAGNIYCRAGSVSAGTRTVTWTPAALFDSGWAPGIAVNPDGTLRQVHRSTAGDSGFLKEDSRSKLYQGAGTISPQTKTAWWSPSTAYGALGYSAAIATNRLGGMWCVHRDKDDASKLLYRPGRWRWTGQTSPFSWGSNDVALPDEGNNLAGAVGAGLFDDGTAVMVFNTLRSSPGAGHSDTVYDGWIRVGQLAPDGSNVTFPGGNAATALPADHDDGYFGVSVDCVDAYGR